MVEIDARKLECPKPVLLTKAETDNGTEELRVQVDNEVAVGNVTRFLESAGYEAKREDAPDGKSFFITGRKTGEAARKSADKKTTAILFASDTLGAESDGLGEVLIKAYLGTIAKADEPPATVALMNAGVKLALPESSTFDTLKEIEARGTKILVCGTCTNHFGITDKIKVGVISNMFEIAGSLISADKTIVHG
ncbi:MAG TPA: sulfurtransferase-like selenium metabolism protein YedF [Candidatus Caccocola faecigallinarum]|nr:sulfurtransferase-like selenium metabolism protein YedF [Candidatus Caccocola faecigallinarum]